MSRSQLFIQARYAIAGLVVLLATACSSLLPQATEAPTVYALDDSGLLSANEARAQHRNTASNTIMIDPPIAAAAFDSSRMVYVRQAYKVEFFAHSEWVDSPAHMLTPLIISAIEREGSLGAAVSSTSGAVTTMRLDTEILRLEQDFTTMPSKVRFTLHATLLDNRTRSVLADRDFDEEVASTMENPQGGVLAANLAVHRVLDRLAHFCAGVAVIDSSIGMPDMSKANDAHYLR